MKRNLAENGQNTAGYSCTVLFASCRPLGVGLPFSVTPRESRFKVSSDRIAMAQSSITERYTFHHHVPLGKGNDPKKCFWMLSTCPEECSKMKAGIGPFGFPTNAVLTFDRRQKALHKMADAGHPPLSASPVPPGQRAGGGRSGGDKGLAAIGGFATWETWKKIFSSSETDSL